MGKKKILKLPRLKMKQFVEILTGHNNLSYFQFKIGTDISPLCRFCEESNENFQHFITDWTRLRQLRLDHIAKFEAQNWKANKLIKFSFTTEIHANLERKDDLVYGNTQFLKHNCSLDDSS